MEVTKQNGKVCFSEQTHTYWNEDDNRKYISVTTLIGKFTPPFDSDFWSSYKALEKLIPEENWKSESKRLRDTKKLDENIFSLYDIDRNEFNKIQQDILDEWEKNKNESCERGTKIHAQIENFFYDKGNGISLKKFGIGGKFECKKDYTDLDLEYGVYPEYLISRESKDGILRLAGQIDLLIKNGNHLTIVDHKTNKEIKSKASYDSKTKSTVKMLYPLNNLEDTTLNHYAMQLSTYAWMLQQLNSDWVIDRLIINHYDHNMKNTLIDVPYYKDEVEKMLKYYKKELIKDLQRERRKPIVY